MARTKQTLENQQAERTKIAYVHSGLGIDSLTMCIFFFVCVCRKLEAETAEKLEGVYQQLMQAGVDRNESERETKLKETLANLQRIFPGWFLINW